MRQQRKMMIRVFLEVVKSLGLSNREISMMSGLPLNRVSRLLNGFGTPNDKEEDLIILACHRALRKLRQRRRTESYLFETWVEARIEVLDLIVTGEYYDPDNATTPEVQRKRQ